MSRDTLVDPLPPHVLFGDTVARVSRIIWIAPNTMLLGYNELFGTGQICLLQPEFVITVLICVTNMHLGLKHSLLYNQEFVNINRVSLSLQNS